MSVDAASRALPDEQLEEKIGGASLENLESVFVDDVMAYTELGLDNLPTYEELYRRAIRQQWSPYEIDFSRDKEEWDNLTEETKQRRLYTLRFFLGGEERVANLLAPLVWSAPNMKVGAFLSTQLYDEVRHTIFFDRFWREVVDPSAPDVDALVDAIKPTDNDNYQYVFYQWLPEVAQKLAADPENTELVAEFMTLYHLITEGTLFITGMRFHLQGARRWGRTFGFYQGFTAATRDEVRHVLFGVRYLKDLLSAQPQRIAPVVKRTVEKCMPFIEGHLTPRNGDYSPYGGQHLGEAWEGYTPVRMQQEMLGYAKKILGRRLSATGMRLELATVSA